MYANNATLLLSNFQVHRHITLLYYIDILCFLRFLLCMFLLYITVLLPVGVIKDD